MLRLKVILKVVGMELERAKFIDTLKGTRFAADAEVKLWPLVLKAVEEDSVDAALDLMNHCFPGMPLNLWVSCDRSAPSERATISGHRIQGKVATQLASYMPASHMIVSLFMQSLSLLGPDYLAEGKTWPRPSGPPYPHAGRIASVI
jgi:hypothetical protein